MGRDIRVNSYFGLGLLRIDISGFTNSEINELSSTEIKESLEIIMSMVDSNTSDMIRESNIHRIMYVYPNTVTLIIERRK